MAEVAKLLFPDRAVGAIEDVSFFSPFKFYRSQPRSVRLQAQFRMEGPDIIADCRLIGSRILHGQSEPEVTTHFSARVRLADEPPKPGKRGKVIIPSDGKRVTAEDLYRLYFHGPAYRVVETSWRSGDEVFGLFTEPLPPNHVPGEAPTLAAPRQIELCFQTAGIWELASEATMGLPYQVGRVTVPADSHLPHGRLIAVVTRNPRGGFDAQVVDEKGQIALAIEGYRTMAMPEAVDPTLLEPLRKAMN